MKQFLATAILLISVFFVRAQSGPQFPELVAKEDYAKAEPIFLQAVEWLNETDLDQQLELRQRTNAFVFTWLNGSPTVKMVIGEGIMKLVKDNPSLAFIYFGNYCKFCINNPDNKYAWDAASAGLRAVAKVYKKGVGVKKTKMLTKLAEAVDTGKLEDWMEENLKKDSLR